MYAFSVKVAAAMVTGNAMTEPYGREGLPLEQARAQILEAVQPLGLQETLPLPQALGRTAAAAVFSAGSVPGFRASIMDGYAISGSVQPELGDRWRLVGVSAAGAPFAAVLAAGEAVRILTGAVVPDGSERVIPQELVAVEGAQLVLVKPCGAQVWIRQPDEEAKSGQELVPAGHRLGVADLGRLASCGVQALVVTRRPRLGLLISGDELLPAGIARGPGQIWESNSALLTALLRRLGYEIADQRVVIDQPAPLRDALRGLAQTCDVVVSTGGVSARRQRLDSAIGGGVGTGAFLEAVLEAGSPLRLGAGGGCAVFRSAGQPGGGGGHDLAVALAGFAAAGGGGASAVAAAEGAFGSRAASWCWTAGAGPGATGGSRRWRAVGAGGRDASLFADRLAAGS